MNLNDLTPEQRTFLYEHGANVHKYDIPTKTAARAMNVSEWTVRQVKKYMAEHGAPDEADRPGSRILVIGDAHAAPDQDLTRFTVLSRFIEDQGREAMADGVPFVVMCIGDFTDMHSLSSYDEGKLSAEGSRYHLDCESGIKAQELLFEHISPEVRKYGHFAMTIGNHEYRLKRLCNDKPALYGTLSYDDLKYDEFWDETCDFQEVIIIEDIAFSHYHPSGVMGRAVSGVNIGRSLIQKGLMSSVQGHSHLLNHSTLTDYAGKRMHGLSVGCWFMHDEDYAKRANDMFWRGICVLENSKDGDYDLCTYSAERLFRKYDFDGNGKIR
jgi:hypothetical protein